MRWTPYEIDEEFEKNLNPYQDGDETYNFDENPYRDGDE
ncbi:hypothetical protein J2S13_003349 [Oikeobacillus pervagus]|uniref:Uncharacterized protein n=1 Tax=Oikeobacillus pervagus TaxID=1325931 RepID=A0AAJ1T588_9BACI|nr:hypothetical protein [Oikeobacillus pervagus]